MKDEDFLVLIITTLSIYTFCHYVLKILLDVALIVVSHENWRHRMVRAFSFVESHNH